LSRLTAAAGRSTPNCQLVYRGSSLAGRLNFVAGLDGWPLDDVRSRTFRRSFPKITTAPSVHGGSVALVRGAPGVQEFM
jgi:hypothetical protein